MSILQWKINYSKSLLKKKDVIYLCHQKLKLNI